MKISFSKKEEKKDIMIVDELTYCYLIAIKDQNQNIWYCLKRLIKDIDGVKNDMPLL